MFKNNSWMVFVVLMILAVFSFSACQKISQADSLQFSNSVDRSAIIGGEIVQPSDLTAFSTVALKYVEGNQAYSLCTGTLISENLVLTAAHCLYWASKNNVRIGFSLDVKDQLDSETMFEVSEIYLHPDYNSSSEANDIALMALVQKAPKPYKPVGILNTKYKLEVGMPMLLAGYGVIDDATGKETEALRKVTVPMAKILEMIIVTDQTKNMGACNGDSGGPAYLEKDGLLYVYGVTRGPHEQAVDCHHFGEYTYASKFEKFIMDGAKKLKTQLPQFVNP